MNANLEASKRMKTEPIWNRCQVLGCDPARLQWTTQPIRQADEATITISYCPSCGKARAY